MERPNPDELLANIKREESQKGKLKIFFPQASSIYRSKASL